MTVAEKLEALRRARLLTHPGRPGELRINSACAQSARHIRLSLRPGRSFADAIAVPLAALGIHSASTTILGGEFEELHFCVAPPDPTGNAVIAYTLPANVGRSQLIFGNATLARDSTGHPIVHCHAVMSTPDGLRGGHVIADRSIIGDRPLSVLVTALTDFDLRVTFDPETNIPLIQPEPWGNHQCLNPS